MACVCNRRVLGSGFRAGGSMNILYIQHHVKLSLFLGFLVTINIANLINILINIVENGGLFWVGNGVIAVVCLLIHAMLVEGLLNDHNQH